MIIIFILLLIHVYTSLNVFSSHFRVPLKRKRGRRRRLSSDKPYFWEVKGHPDKTAIEGADYFYAVLELGTPPKSFDMILDTGSSLAFVPCKSKCTNCGKNHAHPFYDQTLSSSHGVLPCDDQVCKGQLRCRNQECTFDIHYMEGSAVHGTYMKEVLSLSDTKQIPIAIGCIHRETHMIHDQDADGILGIGSLGDRNQPVSFFNQLHDQGFPLSFGLCFATDDRGFMTFGDYMPEGIQFTQFTARKVGITKILLDDDILQVNLNGQRFLVDTGSSDSHFPRSLFTAFHNLMKQKVKGVIKRTGDGNLCIRNSNTTELYASIPVMKIVLQGDIVITSPFPNLIYKKSATYICTTVFSGGSVIGGNALMDHFIFFNPEQNRLGVKHANCGELEDTLQSKEEESERNVEVQAESTQSTEKAKDVMGFESSSTSIKTTTAEPEIENFTPFSTTSPMEWKPEDFFKFTTFMVSSAAFMIVFYCCCFAEEKRLNSNILDYDSDMSSLEEEENSSYDVVEVGKYSKIQRRSVSVSSEIGTGD